MELKEILKKYKSGKLSLAKTEQEIRALAAAEREIRAPEAQEDGYWFGGRWMPDDSYGEPGYPGYVDADDFGTGYIDLGFAKLDTSREKRSGFPEVIFCSGKPDEYLVKIYQEMVAEEGRAFGTRATQHQADLVREVLPQAEYDPVSRILKVMPESHFEKEDWKYPRGTVAVCTGGTSDIPVAEEAAQTIEYFGTNAERVYDVGVSGIHRLLSKAGKIREADCVIAVAGMEGALASVIGGLVENPVIAVPTSVGYGANLHGLSALLTMINSCANGIAVVNIDNGYGAGYVATQISRQISKYRYRDY